MQTIVDDEGVMHEVYTKKEVMDMLENLKAEINHLKFWGNRDRFGIHDCMRKDDVMITLDKHIAEIKGE